MTLVLPFGGDQINNSLFSGPSMPCVFDGEALDFESALMTDWTSDIGDYNATADDFATAAPSDASELKRKSSSSDDSPQQHPAASQPKRPRPDPDSSASSSSGEEPAAETASPASDEDEDDGEPLLPPRRRGPPMWNSRQRWKDERKRVLKMSVAKLSEIEDPELCLHRSVLLNNTVRRLHADVRAERQAKLRQREQQRGDAEKFRPDAPPAAADPFAGLDEELFGGDFLRAPDRRASSPAPPQQQRMDAQPAPPCDTAPPFRRPASGQAPQQQCATQFRTHRDLGGGDVFPPRVPILDSVVYHSLLASLESS